MEEMIFHKILDFAITKEYECERLYHELSSMHSLKRHAAFFSEMARDEVAHARALESLRFRNLQSDLPKKMLEAHGISPHFPPILLNHFASMRDLLFFLTAEEERSRVIYEEIARHIQEADLKLFFQSLAEEESAHHKILKQKASEVI